MAGKILILHWPGSAYDSLSGLLGLIANEFTALGFDAEPFTASGADWPRRLVQRLTEGGIDGALTMSGIAADLGISGTLVWEAAKVPLFNWNCDHPCYFPTRHSIRNRFLMNGYVFPDHSRYTMAHLTPGGTAIPVHLGIPPRSLFPRGPIPLANRNGRIMFAKTGGDPNRIEASWRTFEPALQQILFAAAEDLFHRSTADFAPVLRRLGEKFGATLDGSGRLTMKLIREIDTYLRLKRANMLLNTVLRYPVDVFGSGWDHIAWDGAWAWDGARARLIGSVGWRAMVGQMPRYLGCLSINPLVEDSVHDRTFFALAAGVAPIADSNRFSREHMPALEPYAFTFTRERIEQAIEALLDAPAEALARTETTWQALQAPFGMRHAARQIVRLLEQAGPEPCP